MQVSRVHRSQPHQRKVRETGENPNPEITALARRGLPNIPLRRQVPPHPSSDWLLLPYLTRSPPPIALPIPPIQPRQQVLSNQRRSRVGRTFTVVGSQMLLRCM